MNFLKKVILTIITLSIIASLSLTLIGCPTAEVVEEATPEETSEETTEEATTTEEETTEETTEDQSVDVADIIFYNGVILTLNVDQPQEQAIAIKDESIIAVGSNQDILALQDAESELIDLQGKTLMPGFVDAHTHIFNDAEALLGMNLVEAQQLALQNGITCLADMCVFPEFLQQMQDFEQSGKLKVRTSLYLLYNTNCGDIVGDWYKNHPPTREFGEMLRIGGVKIMSDGGSCGTPAFSFELLRDNLGYGDLWFNQEQMNQIVADAHAAGYQVAIHATGDRAIEQVQNAIQFALEGKLNTLRHRMEHNSLVRPDLLSRYSEIGIVPILHGYYATCIENDKGNWAPYVGEERLSWVRNNRELLDANPGLIFAWHSDYPWVGRVIDPFKQLYALVTRKEVAPDGVTICEPPDWLAETTITAQEGIQMMTIGAAFSLFREEEVGSLESGKFADLIVVSDNPLSVDPNDIKDIKVLLTMVGGKVEYCMQGEEGLCP